MKKILLLGLVLAHVAAAALRAQTVTTTVTNQVNGLSEPYAVAVDGQNNLYITDSANHRIARFKTESGELVTFAGKLREAGAADGTLGASRFFDPRGIVFARGGLVMADSGNHAIRFINLANNTVSTIAGTLGKSGNLDGPGASALFRNPRGLAADSSGNIYVADTRNRAIRKIDINNIVSTIPTGGLLSPAGLALGDNGDLFVSDRLLHAIVKVGQNGFVTPFAGTPGTSGTNDATSAVQASFNGPEGLLWLGSTFGLLVADAENHTLRRIHFDTNVVDNVVETYAGTPGLAGHVDGSLSGSLFDLPSGLVQYSTGFLVVDSGDGVIRQILTSPQQPRIADPIIGSIIVVVDKDSGKSKTKLIPVTEETFSDTIVIGVISERGVRTFFTAGPSRTNVFQPDPIPDPTANSNTAPDYQDGLDPANMPPSLTPPLADLTVKAISMAEGRPSSRIASATFHFQVATPAIDATSAGSVTVRDITTDAAIFYTLDGSEPTQSTLQNPASQGPKASGDKIPITIGTSNLIFKAKAFRANFKPSQIASVELSATNFTPNRISFGFAGGEASSDFSASAGQRFYAPITLSLIPGQTMYGLQFNVTLTNTTGPAPATTAAYGMSFQTMLMELLVDIYRPIPPQAFIGYQTNITTFGSGTNTFTTTNTVSLFTNLLFTNVTTKVPLLGVGWAERKGYGNLYNSGLQDLIKYSIAHDTVFNSAANKVVVGGFSFLVPNTAKENDTYTIAIGRPSGTEDGVAADVFIEAPDGTDPRVAVKAVQTVRVASRRPYIVGDLAPFRWINAGDFGDTNILNNDITQVYEMMALSLNLPPAGSDFEDAIDSCCISTNGVDLSTTSNFFDGTDTTINSVGFGDGKLNVADLFVTFRRSLDTNLVWYARFWSNGVRQAVVVPNVYRGKSESGPMARQRITAKSDSPDQPAIVFSADNFSVVPGQVAKIPVRANIQNGFPLRIMMMNLKVAGIDGAPLPSGPIRFVPSPQLGTPTFGGAPSPTHVSGAWLNDSGPGLYGNVVLGTLEVPISADAPPNSAYCVTFERTSASPNGIAIFRQDTTMGLLTMSTRTAPSFNDGIPDWWRAKYYNSLVNLLSMAAADGDGDGIPNIDEFRNGTNPTVSDMPLFRVSATPFAHAGITLRWPTMSGKSYILERAPNLVDGVWTTIVSNIAGTGGLVEYTDPTSNNLQFYRVRVAE